MRKRLFAALLLAAALLLSGCGSVNAGTQDAARTQTTQTQTEQAQQSAGTESSKSSADGGAEPAADAGAEQSAPAKAGSGTGAADAGKTENAGKTEKTGSAGASEASSSERACTITITCANLVGNLDRLPEAERGLVPADGLLLAKTEMEFSDGDSVFDVLKRAAKDNKIQMEYSTSPAYNTAYIEGIGNLYEFDAGSASGWCYTVNGDEPDVGCSQYALSDGDDIVFAYTLDLGGDV